MRNIKDKRKLLIQAAKILMHKQGFNLTTLADIAEEAGVPLGNVYYYFKTKESIGVAVIATLSTEYAELRNRWDEMVSPSQKLRAFVQFSPEQLELIGRFGCPVGGLCQELGKQGGTLADQAAKLLHDVKIWLKDQFKAIGFDEAESMRLALFLISAVQGTHLLTHTFKDPKLANCQSNSMLQWLNNYIGEEETVINYNLNTEETII